MTNYPKFYRLVGSLPGGTYLLPLMQGFCLLPLQVLNTILFSTLSGHGLQILGRWWGYCTSTKTTWANPCIFSLSFWWSLHHLFWESGIKHGLPNNWSAQQSQLEAGQHKSLLLLLQFHEGALWWSMPLETSSESALFKSGYCSCLKPWKSFFLCLMCCITERILLQQFFRPDVKLRPHQLC